MLPILFYKPDPGRKTNCKDVDPAPEKNPALFVSGFMPIKFFYFFLSKFKCLLPPFFRFTSVFKNNKSLRSHKTVGIKVFLTILLDDRRIQIHTSD
jgi:hypothetical protein